MLLRMEEFRLPRSGPMPRPESRIQAVQVLVEEAFEAPAVSRITFETSEFTSVCPISGQPDFARVRISYTPQSKCLESKALKFYLWSYRNEPGFSEALAAQIADDVVEAIDPLWLEVTVEQTPRGGLGLTAVAERKTNPENPVKI